MQSLVRRVSSLAVFLGDLAPFVAAETRRSVRSAPLGSMLVTTNADGILTWRADTNGLLTTSFDCADLLPALIRVPRRVS